MRPLVHAQLGVGSPTPIPSCPYGYTLGDGCPQADARAQVIYPTLLTDAPQSTQTYVSAPFTGTVSGGTLTISSTPPTATAATASWIGGGYITKISVPSGLVGIVPGLIIKDTTIGMNIGQVISYSGTTITTPPLYYASGGSTDSLSFIYISTGTETLSGTGIPAGVHLAGGFGGSGTGGAGTYPLDANRTSGLSASGTFTAIRRAPWNVAGLDFPVGNITPVGSMNDPANCSGISSCSSWCSYNATGSDNGNPRLNCTIAAATTYALTQFNFGPVGGHGCTGVAIFGTNPGAYVKVIDNNFDNDANCGGTLSAFVVQVSETYSLLMANNTFNGESPTFRWETGTQTAYTGVGLGRCSTVVDNVFINFQARTGSYEGYPNCIMDWHDNYISGWSSTFGGDHPESIAGQINQYFFSGYIAGTTLTVTSATGGDPAYMLVPGTVLSTGAALPLIRP